MSGRDGTLRAQFLESDGTVLRFAISVSVSGDDVKPEPLSILYFGGTQSRVIRLAQVERKGQGWLTKTPPDPIEKKNRPLVIDLDDPPKHGASFVRWTVFIEVTAGKGTLRISHPDAKEHFVPLSGKVNTPKPLPVVLQVGKFPRLVVGLNQAAVPKHGAKLDPTLGTADQLRPIVDYVVRRLQGAAVAGNPLEPAWSVQGAQPLPDTMPTTAKLAHAEEAWARQVTEMLTLTPYGGTGLTYFSTFNDDGVFLAENLDGREATPSVYGLIHACQHLAAFGISSRGRPAHRFQDQTWGKGKRLVNAGSGSAKTVPDIGGTWIIGGNPPKPVTVKLSKTGGIDPNQLTCDPSLQHAKAMYEIDGMNGCDFAPGSVFVMANRKVRNDMTGGGNGSAIQGDHEVVYDGFTEVARWRIGMGGRLADNTDGAHIGFVLRTDPSVLAGVTPKDEGKFQLLDTGGFGVVGRGNGVTVLKVGQGFHSGNFDGPDATQISGKSSDMYRGIGVWPRMKVSEAKPLFDHVKNVLEKLRPLGLARMFILDRSKLDTGINGGKIGMKDLLQVGTPSGRWMLYASPLVPMYEADAHANYSLSRYVWSLRGVPAADQVEVRWAIFLPTRGLARALIAGGRGMDLNTAAEQAFAGLTNPLRKRKLSKPDGTADIARVLHKYTVPLLELRSLSSGQAEVVYKYPKRNNMSALLLGGGESWDHKTRLPMDQTVMVGDATPDGFPEYVR